MDILSYCLIYCLLTEKHLLLGNPTNKVSSFELWNAKLSLEKNHGSLQNNNQRFKISQLPFLNQEGKKVIPVDQAEVNRDFFNFREKLRKALEDKDLDFLLSHLDENVKLTFGGRYGKKDFIQLWNLAENPENSDVWQVLLDVIELGGRYGDKQRNSFIAPYTFFAEEIEDAFEDMIVIGENVTVRQTSTLQGQILGFLSYDVVKRVYESNLPQETINGETYPWIKIKTTEGVFGYVYGKYIRSPIDYRVNFVKKDNTWKIVFFIAGD